MQEGRCKILLLGEESYNRQLLEDILQQRGYEVNKARSAAEAERVLDGRLDLIVVDQRVRGTNGLTWIRRLRERGYNMPVVFCSASNCSAKTFNVLRNLLKVSLIVRKPLIPLVLSNQIQSLLPAASILSCDSSAEDADILEFSPPAENDSGSWLKDYNAEQETRAALEELGRTYLSEMPEMLYELRAQIEAAMSAGEDLTLLESASTTAHQIKGTAGSLGFQELSRLAAEIERALKAAIDSGETSERGILLRALIVVTDIEAWLEAWQDSNKTWADSFCIKFEAEQSESEPIAALWEDPVMEGFVDKSGGDGAKRAFIVDTNLLRAHGLAGILSRDGQWLAEILPGGVKALAALQDCRPELLILDADGDGDELSGFDICRMIRCHPKWADLTIILLTEDTGIECREAIFQCGANDFIVKPVVEQELLNRLSSMIAPDLRKLKVDYKTA